MAFVALNEMYVARIYCTLGNQLSINALHYKVVAVVAGTTDTAIATTIATIFGPLWRAVMTDPAVYRGVGVSRVFPPPPFVETFSTVGQGPGAVPFDPLPKQTSGVITKRTAFAGPKYRGRVYLPFPAEFSNDPTEGRPSAAYKASAQVIADSLNDQQAVIGHVGSVIEPHLWHDLTSTSDAITTCVVRSFWGTQRRRGDYGETNISPI